MSKLRGTRALITGSSSGIGAGVAAAFAAAGADIVINYPSEKEEADAEKVAATVREAGRQCLPVEADISDEASVARLHTTAKEFLGHIDILVNNAGIAETVRVEEMSSHSWDKMLSIHLRGTFLMTRQCLPGMYARDYGKIINTASQLAYLGAPGYAHYTAAKAGIIGFTRSLALEIGDRGINVNCVAPGATHTPLLDSAASELLEKIRASIPKGRFADVSEIAPAYVFLASEEARFFHGQCISPNGGDVFL